MKGNFSHWPPLEKRIRLKSAGTCWDRGYQIGVGVLFLSLGQKPTFLEYGILSSRSHPGC
eukprot:1156027-Pelagomonas_calceolata.AAC.8